MSLKVIKFVAGGGKTTESINYLQNSKNGIYLAFNNKVVDEISRKGYLSKTIDSLFVSFLIPKLISIVPIISPQTCKIEYMNSRDLEGGLKGVSNIHINKDGKIFNKNHDTGFTLFTKSSDLYTNKNCKNLCFLKKFFVRTNLFLQVLLGLN